MAGIRMNKSFGSLIVGAGGFENLPFLEKDCRNYIDKARHLRLGKGGAGALQEYFCRMQYKNPGFFALMDLDDKGREVQMQLTDIIDLDPELLKRDGAVKTYLVEDEVRVEEFSKLVTFSMDFNDEDADVKCSCGLFQMRGILCRHILAVFKCNGRKSLPEKYILDRWRKDIKRRYTLIDSSYDAGDQRPDACRYSSLLKVCYQMITYAAGSKKHTEDATHKLHAMIELYSENQEPPSITLTGSNVGCTQNDTITLGSSKQVLNPLVVRGKGRPPSLRRASRMEKEMRKLKGKTKKAPVNRKRKQLVQNKSAIVIDGTQIGRTVQFGLDGSQPEQLGLDDSQLETLGFIGRNIGEGFSRAETL
ncbi:protein FAR1-RELATED SEQUENCE 2-like [Juglans regia]|uniref:Protein FAR1-RELATED SEQUENCE n=1 Tax=Juglans regia TaxID=51240 RepID=A0A6P9F8U6_JUGRE|nr:protein FAR1-RELATED SEQUENCE 2-like [Juglans regia]